MQPITTRNTYGEINRPIFTDSKAVIPLPSGKSILIRFTPQTTESQSILLREAERQQNRLPIIAATTAGGVAATAASGVAGGVTASILFSTPATGTGLIAGSGAAASWLAIGGGVAIGGVFGVLLLLGIGGGYGFYKYRNYRRESADLEAIKQEAKTAATAAQSVMTASNVIEEEVMNVKNNITADQTQNETTIGAAIEDLAEAGETARTLSMILNPNITIDDADRNPTDTTPTATSATLLSTLSSKISSAQSVLATLKTDSTEQTEKNLASLDRILTADTTIQNNARQIQESANKIKTIANRNIHWNLLTDGLGLLLGVYMMLYSKNKLNSALWGGFAALLGVKHFGHLIFSSQRNSLEENT